MEPKQLKYLLIAIALLYLLFPRDLIPDFSGRGLGLVDDILLIAALSYFYRRQRRAFANRARGEFAQAAGEPDDPKANSGRRTLDPYEILGIPTSSSPDTIRSAYRARMTEYHPDKVAHLGEELQELARRKVLEIQQAYQLLSK